MNSYRRLALLATKAATARSAPQSVYNCRTRLALSCLRSKRLVHTTQNNRNIDDDEDSIDLDSIFKLLDVPEDNTRSNTSHQPGDSGISGSARSDNSDDVDIDALLGSIISSGSNGMAKASATSDNKQHARSHQREQRDNEDDEAMKEFERILSDMATRKDEVYKQRSQRPAPLFWQDRGIGKEGQDFIKDLGPEMLFKSGPRASAYSANKLAGDMSKVSALAKRLRRKPAKDESDPAPRVGELKRRVERRGATSHVSGRLGKRDMELEQVLLSRLANCTSVPRLSSFVYDEIEGKNIATIRGFPDALPSPLVYAETIRKARELGVPSVALYVFRHCRSFIDVMSKTRVLNSDVYEELLLTAWGAMRDPVAASFVIRDAIIMGVAASASMVRYIDQIVFELRTTYSMDSAAARITQLKNGLEFSH
ncbi:hypothetical protein GGI22_005043 [Coemansia erecta]|nr:hypothetical protein GGI22_005043 [Coemansia erecta]